jgi:hypothetical protein
MGCFGSTAAGGEKNPTTNMFWLLKNTGTAMRIESFGEFGFGIQFGKNKSDAAIFRLNPRDSTCGVGSILNGVLVAFYKKEDNHFVRIGEDFWEASNQSLSIEFRHGDEGISYLTVKRSGTTLRELIYSSWWLRQEEGSPPGFGNSDDEEHDFGAYLAFMWQVDTRKKHLMKKYR